MKILVVSQYFWPENFSINLIATYLAEQGHEVDVLTGIPNYPQGSFYEGYGYFSNLHQMYNKVKVDRVWIKARGQKGGDKRLILNYLSYAASASAAMLGRLHKKYDVSFVYEMSPITQAYPAIFLRMLGNVPMCLYVGDLWPDTLFSHGIRGGNVKRIVASACSYIYKKSDYIIAANKSFMGPIKKYMNNSRPIKYIPQAVDELYKPHNRNGELRKQLSIKPTDFIVMFAGNLGYAQSVKTVMEAAKLTKNHEHICYVFVGDGTLKPECEAFSQANQLTNCFFIGRKKPEEMPQLIAEADVLLVTLKNQSNYNLTLPGRTQAYMACGKPIICCANGETSRVISEAGCGFTAEAENAAQLADRIKECSLMDMQQLAMFGKRGLQYSQEHYDRHTVLAAIEQVLKDTADANRYDC